MSPKVLPCARPAGIVMGSGCGTCPIATWVCSRFCCVQRSGGGTRSPGFQCCVRGAAIACVISFLAVGSSVAHPSNCSGVCSMSGRFQHRMWWHLPVRVRSRTCPGCILLRQVEQRYRDTAGVLSTRKGALFALVGLVWCAGGSSVVSSSSVLPRMRMCSSSVMASRAHAWDVMAA